MNRADLQRLTRARRHRQDLKAFDALILAPASGSVTLPANGRFAFVALADVPAGTPIAQSVGPSTRNFISPAMTTGQKLVVDNFERATVVTLEAGFELYVLDNYSNPHKIGEPA